MVTSHRRSSSEPGQTPGTQRAEGRLPTIAGRFDPYDLPWGDGGSNEPIRPKPSKPSSGNRKASQGPRGDAPALSRRTLAIVGSVVAVVSIGVGGYMALGGDSGDSLADGSPSGPSALASRDVESASTSTSTAAAAVTTAKPNPSTPVTNQSVATAKSTTKPTPKPTTKPTPKPTTKPTTPPDDLGAKPSLFGGSTLVEATSGPEFAAWGLDDGRGSDPTSGAAVAVTASDDGSATCSYDGSVVDPGASTFLGACAGAVVDDGDAEAAVSGWIQGVAEGADAGTITVGTYTVTLDAAESRVTMVLTPT